MDATGPAAAELDATDPLRHCRARFALPDGVVYLDGNSLGALPAGVAARVAAVIEQEWRVGLIRSWNDAGWWDAPVRVGARLARLLGAAPDEVAMADSTSVNLFKLVVAAARLRPGRRVVLSEAGNFPTDLYVLDAAARLLDLDVRHLPPGAHLDASVVASALDEAAAGGGVAVVALTHVDYRTGAMYDMAEVTALAHRAGAVMLWDLAHSAGAVPLALDAYDVDLAVGCTYKYLNGGPGAPAYCYVNRRLHGVLEQPLTGWTGHADPFAFDPEYQPAGGIARVLCGTPPVLGLAAVDAALDAFDGVDVDALRAKSLALTDRFLAGVDARLGDAGFTVVTPRDHAVRGSQVSLAHPDAGPMVQALKARGVIGDYRAPDVLRFGFAPLYVRYADVDAALDALELVVRTEQYRDPAFAVRAAVT